MAEITRAAKVAAEETMIIAIVDGVRLQIPEDPDNKDYASLREWVTAGNAVIVTGWWEQMDRAACASTARGLLIQKANEMSEGVTDANYPKPIQLSWDEQDDQSDAVTAATDPLALTGIKLLDGLRNNRGKTRADMARRVQAKKGLYEDLVIRLDKLIVDGFAAINDARTYPDADALGAHIDALIAAAKTDVDAIIQQALAIT